MTDHTFVDDPARDYRRRYRLPDQFLWDMASWPRIDFDGYTAMALSLLPPAPARVLDIGCGPGAGAARLVEHGYEVTGVDFNERAISFARLLVDGATFHLADIRALGAKAAIGAEATIGAGFDAAWCIEVLEHVPPSHRTDVFEGIRARLRPGGVLVLTTPSPLMHDNVWDYRRASLAELRSGLEDAGLRVRDVMFQHRLTPLFSPSAWRLVSNAAFDLRIVRMVMRRVFLRRWNDAGTESRAGRYVIRADRETG